ncbi:hypothetical protein Tco_0530483 [Tanacetum coccineum]
MNTFTLKCWAIGVEINSDWVIWEKILLVMVKVAKMTSVDFPDQDGVALGGTLSIKGRTALCALLKRNLDIFAWQPADMTGARARWKLENVRRLHESKQGLHKIVTHSQRLIGRSNPSAVILSSASWMHTKVKGESFIGSRMIARKAYRPKKIEFVATSIPTDNQGMSRKGELNNVLIRSKVAVGAVLMTERETQSDASPGRRMRGNMDTHVQKRNLSIAADSNQRPIWHFDEMGNRPYAGSFPEVADGGIHITKVYGRSGLSADVERRHPQEVLSLAALFGVPVDGLFPVIHHPPQATDTEMLQARENLMETIQAFLNEYDHIPPEEKCMALLLAEERKRFLYFKQNFPMADDDEYTIIYRKPKAITPNLPTEEPEYSLSMGDKHLDTISEMESDKVIKSSVENLVPIPKERNYENVDTIIESPSPVPIPVEDSDSHMEEIDLFHASDDSMPPGIENDDYDTEGDIRFLEELLSNDPLPLPEIESSNLDHFIDPSSPRPPPEPPDVEIYFDVEPDTTVKNDFDELNEDECFNPGGLTHFENSVYGVFSRGPLELTSLLAISMGNPIS